VHRHKNGKTDHAVCLPVNCSAAAAHILHFNFVAAFDFNRQLLNYPDCDIIFAMMRSLPNTVPLTLRLMRALLAAAAGLIVFASPSEQQQMKARGCPNGSGPCNMKRSPLICGPKKCLYQNSCLAKLNGFDVAEDCRREYMTMKPAVPTPAPDRCFRVSGPCPKVNNPVKCGPDDCVFANPCLATVNGFDVDKDCVFIDLF
jgi:hypothetical protein